MAIIVTAIVLAFHGQQRGQDWLLSYTGLLQREIPPNLRVPDFQTRCKGKVFHQSVKSLAPEILHKQLSFSIDGWRMTLNCPEMNVAGPN